MIKQLIWGFHNIIVHPIAGLFWLVGMTFTYLGDVIHDGSLLGVSDE